MGISDDLAHASVRFGLGRFNTREEVDYVVGRFAEKVKLLRDLAPDLSLASVRTDAEGQSPG
jgi:cysteine desulfurase